MYMPTRAYEDPRLAGVTESSTRNAVALNEFCTSVSCIPWTCLSVVDRSQSRSSKHSSITQAALQSTSNAEYFCRDVCWVLESGTDITLLGRRCGRTSKPLELHMPGIPRRG